MVHWQEKALREAKLKSETDPARSDELLNQVVAFYNRGGDFTAPNKPNLIHPLNLTAAIKSGIDAIHTDEGRETLDRGILQNDVGECALLCGHGREGGVLRAF